MKRWAPPVIWGAMILGFSGDMWGAPQTSRFIVPLLRWLFPQAAPETILLLHGLVRKLAHVVEYGIFAALWFRAFRWRSLEAWDRRWVIYPLLIVGPWAMVDEYRQTWTATRTGAFTDVFLDLAGAVMALCLLTWITRWEQSRRQKENCERSPAGAAGATDRSR